MRPRPLLALPLLLAGCGAAPATADTPMVVNIPAAPAPGPAGSAPDPAPAHAPLRNPQPVLADDLNARLQAGGGHHQSVEIEPSGRVIVKDESDHDNETEFHLQDVDHVDYDKEAGRTRPYLVRLWIKPSGMDRHRWRPKDGAWRPSTMSYVVLALPDKPAAEGVMLVLRSAMGQ